MAATSLIAAAQSSVATGAIVGTVTNPSAAVVAGAKVSITNLDTNQTADFTTTSSGLYDSGAIVPGRYKVKVEAKGFKATEMALTVELGAVTSGNVRLEAGQENTLVKIQTSSLVNSQQPTVQGVVTTQQIEDLPIDGWNFLELAQLEPGVQIQDGQGIDPTKNGFSSISIGGRTGRTARIELDGVDISDEVVGATTQNISAGSIQEIQIARSSLDLSSSLTSSGAVNVTTKSGSNALHGQGTYFFRDQSIGFAKFPGGRATPYQRNQPGGNIGGPVIKDKLFFFAAAEHTKQDFQNGVVFPGNFATLSGAYNAPFRDTEYLGRLDYVFRRNAHLFYRFTYNSNRILRPASDFSPFLNRNRTKGDAGGFDFNTGSLTHSLRFGYNKFWNGISSASGDGIYDPFPRLNIVIGALATGPNFLAPQVTIQSNKQARYDGSKPWKNHVFRYGAAVNRIAAGGFAAFGADAPTVYADPADTSNLGGLAGAATNPLNYAVTGITVWNGQGFFSEKPAFGYPGGGNFDTRIDLYAGDAWKLRPNFTLTYGVHYVRDTGRTDSDVAPIPCSATTLLSCTGNLLDQFGYGGLGNRVRQPNKNFGPQVGFAWDPSGKGSTVFRGGVGLYYENNLFNNILFDRAVRTQKAAVFGSAALCPSGNLPWPDGTVHTSSDGLDIASQICGQPIGATVNGVVVGSAITDLQQTYQAAVAAAGTSNNPFFVGSTLNTFASLLAPTYVSPRAVQMNLGIQKQIKRDTVFSVDYVRNAGTHFLLGVDTNQVGDSRTLNVGAAQAAIAATTQSYNCSGGYTEAAIQCAIAGGASIINFAQRGLDSANAYCGGYPCSLFGLPNAAFGGVNPNVGANVMYFPVGHSLYSGVQTSLRSGVQSPFRGTTHMNLQISYAYSHFRNDVPTGSSTIPGDQDFLTAARDYRSPNRFFGPSAQDRTHQFSFGAILDLVKGFQLSALGHLASPLPLTMYLPQEFHGGDIFISDVTGDGTVGDIVPGSNVGSFGRSVSASGLTHFISSYLTNSGGRLTPAGQALVSAGIMTQQDLVTLGATTPVDCPLGQKGFLSNGIPCINTPPFGNAGLGWLKSIDVRLGWTYRIKERVSLQPSVSFYNVANFANFDGPGNLPSGVLGGTPGYNINNLTNFSACTNCSAKQATRIGPGSGTFSLGAPRQAEFALRITF